MTKPKDISEAPGWAAPREPKDEAPGKTLTNQGALDGWAGKAAARSGPKFMPGTGRSS